MCAKAYRNAFVAGVAIVAAAAALHVSSAQAGSVTTTNCMHGFGYARSFGYGHSYSGGYGSGYFGGNSSGYGSGSGSGYGDGSCVETRGPLVNPYVIRVPQPQTEQETTETATRERLWQARCRPVIRQDQYGVRRYHYAAPGCEYGKYE
jgi:hypothetical protein